MTDSNPQSSRPVASSWTVLLLLLLALVPYARVLRNDFAYIYDDKAQIIDNPYVHTFGHLREALTTPVWSFADAHSATNYYRPVMTLGFLLCYQIFGPVAFGFHLASLMLHLAVVILVFLVARELLGSSEAAWAAAVFAVHPIHVESVAWISAVTDLEVTFFYLLTFLIFLRLSGARGRNEWFLRIAMAGSFVLALLSKEQALTLAVLAAIYEHFFRDDRKETSWRQKVSRYGPLWLVLCGYLIARVHFMGAFAHPMGWASLTPSQTVYSALALFGQYIAKLFWPARLSAFYIFHATLALAGAPGLAGVLAAALCAIAFFALLKPARPAAFGILWLVCTLAPVLNARWMGTYVLADRYAYLPSVGFCLVVGWAWAKLWKAARQGPAGVRWTLGAIACVVLALGALRIATRIGDWYDDITLLSRALQTEPKEFILRDALGDAYWLHGEMAPAEREWKESLRIQPDFYRPLNALGALCARQGRFAEAEDYFRKTLAVAPTDADAILNLGGVYAQEGKLDLAEEQFRRALALKPLNVTARNVLGKLYYDSGRPDEAEEQFRDSLQVEPNLAAFDHLGFIYARRDRWELAEAAFRSALAIDPADLHAHYELGIHYAAEGRTADALGELKAAQAADPQNPDVLSALEKLQQRTSN